MTNTTLPVPPAPGERAHVFGAIGTDVQLATAEETRRRERMAAEAARMSGNFYVSRMVSMFGSAKAPQAA